jgi:glycosyltransferase involved in cell wall biosynthesis
MTPSSQQGDAKRRAVLLHEPEADAADAAMARADQTGIETPAFRGETLRVLHIVPTFYSADGGIIGGAERYALELASHMSQAVPTILLSFGDRETSQMIGKLAVRVLGNPWYIRGQRTNPVVLAGLWAQVRKASVVHCHQQHVLASSLTAAMCRVSGRRVFVSDLGGGGWDVSSYVSTDAWYHGHLHLSEYSRRVFGHAERDRAHVIYGGVDTDKFCPDRSIAKDGTVLFVGRLLPHKGIDGLIKAMPGDMTLEIVGRAYDARYYRDLQRLAEGKKVIFQNNCEDEELVNAYRRALCIVLPSVYRTMYGEETAVPELLGQTLLEGMACGIPAICTDVASMPEVVENETTGFVVPPGSPDALREKILWLRDHPLDSRTMGDSARRRVLDHFTWRAVVRRCLAIYTS